MKDNGNFLGAVELLTQFNPFIASHVEQFADSGKGIPSYQLSKTIYEEVIIKIHKSLTNVILAKLKRGKYYSIIVDSTPDIAHVDQLVFAVRYECSNGELAERFLLFMSNNGHKSKELKDAVVRILSDYEIPIEDCRGQSYDNAFNMSGSYTGLQARIKELNPLAEYIHCSGHSLSLVGTNAVENCLSASNFLICYKCFIIFFHVLQIDG